MRTARLKFYFDSQTHLLVYITDMGITSAYHQRTIGFDDYRKVDAFNVLFECGLRRQLRMLHRTRSGFQT